MRGWKGRIATIVAAALLSGCYGIRISVQLPEAPAYKVVTRPAHFADDLDIGSLRRAIDASRKYFATANPEATYTLGNDSYTTRQIARSVEKFAQILDETDPRRLSKRLARECRAYRPRDTSQFTAYYEPALRASLHRSERFRYPIYQKPDELTLVRLARFFPNDPRQFHGAVRRGELLPYLTRKEIDGRGLLRDRGLELAWVEDPVALYFLHIQGSGRLLLDDGRVLRVNYAASNGVPYFSIGRYMLDHGIITAGSSSAIRSFLSANPDRRDRLMFRNPRYIFFREVSLAENDGPVGSLGVPLVAGRSIASDHRYVPPGAVVFMNSDRPLVDAAGRLVGWDRLARFALNHDSGSAIKGPGRVDVYWGEGERAGAAAGYMNKPGRLAVLVCGVRPTRSFVASAGALAWTRVSWPAADLSRKSAAGL